MDIVWFLIIGAVAGWLAGKFTKGSGFGLVGDIIVGVIGALVGGLLGLGGVTLIGRILAATVGALIFLFLLGFFAAKKA